MDYTAWSRQYGKARVRLLGVPAWDFVVDVYMHGRIAELRGVENGFTVIRTAQQGLLYITDGYGRLVSQKSSGSGPEVMLVHSAPAGPGETIYDHLGDWFGWANVLALIGVVAACIRAKGPLRGSTP